ncbi:hypothetical protein [Siphonobacter sp. SORGH_AS_0500]|uniref:hypothetical protein n=1 Tax=Siphonobacter sp. SORGH_AS_0500 TaxID=1864824 RepID=UPI00286C7445|nr:hypothetical protein [Siphonobacter sp. SORGH_AS_0500]
MSVSNQKLFEELLRMQSPEQWANDFNSIGARGMSIRDRAMTYEQQVEQNKRFLNFIRALYLAEASQA